MTNFFYGPGADNVTATAAGDQLFGGDGADTLTATAGGNQLHGDAGDDVLNGGAGNDQLDGGSDTVIIEHNVLNGFGGDDTIFSGSWGDQIFGGDGNDTVQVTALRSGQVVDGGSGTDTLFLLALTGFTQSMSVHMGSTFQPIVSGVNGATYVNFENLYVVGGSGSNTLIGGAGDDTIMNSYSNVSSFQGGVLKGGAGKDEISFYGLPVTGGGTMQLDGGKGSQDTLAWANGLASFVGTLEIDVAAGTMKTSGVVFANFTGFEAVKIQTYSGASGDITFTGGAGVDTLDLNATTSTLSTLDGNDVVLLRSGQTNLHAGLGDDVVTVDFTNTSAQNLFGDGGNDRMLSGSGQSTLTGDDGNDTLTSYNGKGHLLGGAGDDTLYLTDSYSVTGTGAAVLYGGSGRDTLSLSLSNSTQTFIANFAANRLVLVDGTKIDGIEAVGFSAGVGNDSLTASNDAAGYLANSLGGNAGNDTLRASASGASLDGGTGNDLLVGSGGADSLNGSLDNDILRGAGGNDTLLGGYGRDTMTGGAGADHFVFAAFAQTGKDAATRDLITDFTQADLDRIDLSAIDADGNFANGKTPFHFIGNVGFHGIAGELRFFRFNPAGTAHDVTVVAGDTNGDGIADFQIGLNGLHTLVLGDFILA